MTSADQNPLRATHIDLVFRGASFLVLGICGVVIFSLRFCGGVPLPNRPEPPEDQPINAHVLTEQINNTPFAFRAQLKSDAQRFGVSPPPVSTLELQFDDHSWKGTRRLAVGSRWSNGGLELTARKIRVGSVSVLALDIRNLTENHLAYRVVAHSSRGIKACKRRPQITHNTIALPPLQTAQRSICALGRGSSLVVTEVENVMLVPISYHYLLQLKPTLLGIPLSIAQAHELPARSLPCRAPRAASISRAMAKGETTWRDLVDFFSRHSCDTYRFVPGFRAFRGPGQLALPVSARD